MEIRHILKEINSRIKPIGHHLKYCKHDALATWNSLTYQQICKYTTTTNPTLINLIYSINNSLLNLQAILNEYNQEVSTHNRDISEAFEILWNVSLNFPNIANELGFKFDLKANESISILKIKAKTSADQQCFLKTLGDSYGSFLCGSSYLLNDNDYHILFIPKIISNWTIFELSLAMLYENFILKAFQDHQIEQYKSTINQLMVEINSIQEETSVPKKKKRKSKSAKSHNKKLKNLKERLAAKKIQSRIRIWLSQRTITLDKLNIKNFVINFNSDLDTCLEEDEDNELLWECSSDEEIECVIEGQYARANNILNMHAVNWEYIDHMRRLCLLPIVNTYYKPHSYENADTYCIPIIQTYYQTKYHQIGYDYYYTPDEFK